MSWLKYTLHLLLKRLTAYFYNIYQNEMDFTTSVCIEVSETGLFRVETALFLRRKELTFYHLSLK